MNMKCLLLADRDPATVEKIARSLDPAEFRVASSLAEALPLIDEVCPDLVLLNLNLGEPGSLEALHAVRAATDAVVVVLLDEEDHMAGVESMRAGADEYAFKEFLTAEGLRALVRSCFPYMGLRRTRKQIRNCLTELCRMGGAS